MNSYKCIMDLLSMMSNHEQNIYTNLAGLSSHLDEWERIREAMWLSWPWLISLRVSSISNIEFGGLRSPQDTLSRVYVSNCRMWRKDAVSARLGQGGFIRTYRIDGGVGKSPSPKRKPKVTISQEKARSAAKKGKGARTNTSEQGLQERRRGHKVKGREMRPHSHTVGV